MESQDSVYDVVKASPEGLIPNKVKQFERNATNFLQEEYASNNPIGQEAGIGVKPRKSIFFFSSENERIGNSYPERYKQNPRFFSRSQMTKRITPLESSREI